MDYEKLALGYHSRVPKGKIGIYNKKPLETLEDLALAYSPGVAGPCRHIHKKVDESFTYTSRANLVGVISNGSAVLGLGNIGPFASKPVMEGKAMLFKHFANIDVFDLEVNASSCDEFIQIVKSLEPTFGGINLEDIKAPDCFYIEEQLVKHMSIPVFHDDQHGTAIISGAAFLNAMELTGRELNTVKVVFNGAGAAAIACAKLFLSLGVVKENIVMCDSQGVLHDKREGLNPYKKEFVTTRSLSTLSDALVDADAFIGVSVANVLTESMLLTMNKNPIVFALANPDPEIKPELAKKVRSDVIIATGRSDYPNQVNNVLGFPYIFRGALDVRAKKINDAMKLAAVKAIASLAKEAIPEEVVAVYKDSDRYVFGRDYLIPKPVDHRMLLKVAPAVAKAAMETGVARIHLDLNEYKDNIENILGPNRKIIRHIRQAVNTFSIKKKLPRVVLTSGENSEILKAVKQVADTGELHLVLLGDKKKILAQASQIGLHLPKQVEIIDPKQDSRKEAYSQEFFKLRQQKGLSSTEAKTLLLDENYFAAMMLRSGDVDAMINGIRHPYRASIKPILQTIGVVSGEIVAGIYFMVVRGKLTFFADCSVNIDPSATELSHIALETAKLASQYTQDPIRIGMLSFASFGNTPHPQTKKVRDAVQLIRVANSSIEVDGEMQVDIALNKAMRLEAFPHCQLTGNANVLVFPDLASANIGYKLVSNFTEATPVGPVLIGLKKAATVLQRVATAKEIIDMIYITVHQWLMLNKK